MKIYPFLSSKYVFLLCFLSASQLTAQKTMPLIDVTGIFSERGLTVRWYDDDQSNYASYHIEYLVWGGSTEKAAGSLRVASGEKKEIEIPVDNNCERVDVTVSAHASDGRVLARSYTERIKRIVEAPYTSALAAQLNLTLNSFSSSNFPLLYSQVTVDTSGVTVFGLQTNNFRAFENGVLQTDLFDVTPPSTGGGVRIADIVFVMDNSGSMSDVQAAVVANVRQFVDSLVARGINMRLGLVRFGQTANGDYGYTGSPIAEDNGVTTSDVNYFKNTVLARNISSGGQEPGFHALIAATQRFSYRPGVQKIFILITDEDNDVGPAPYNYSLAQTVGFLQSASAVVYGLVNRNDGTSITDYIATGSVTQATGGRAFQIRQDQVTTMLNYINFQAAAQYTVRYRSSNPVLDGTTRIVKFIVNAFSQSDTVQTSYVPGAAPSIQRTTATQALHNQSWAEGTSFTIEADIVDNVAPLVQSARLYYRRTGDPNYSSVSMTRQTGNVYRGIVPGSAVRTPGLDYYITATDGQTTSSDPRTDPANSPYQFGILPNVAPVITHTPVTTLTPGSPITITATIVDNTNSLSAARLYYRKTGQLLYQQVAMTSTGGSNYQAAIPASYVTTDGIDYYIYAVDNFGVSSTHGTTDRPHKIEPEYILKRPSGMGIEPFQLNIHAWRFDNSRPNMWPPGWWSQFNYCQYPYPQGWCGTPANDFPDWPLFVEAFGEDQCYLNPPPGVVIYDPRAVAKWFLLKKDWGGSCFGFSTSSLLFFDNRFSLADTFGVTTLYNIQDANFNGGHSRRFINRYFLYQFTLSRTTHTLLHRFLPSTWALNDIKRMFLSSDRDNRTLSIYGRSSDGTAIAHSIVPYKVTTGDPVDTIFVYDNNAPNQTQRITVNKDANTWSYPDDPRFGGSDGLFLMDQISSYTSHPGLLKNKGGDIASQSDNGPFVQFLNTSNTDIVLKNPQGDSLGCKSRREFISMPNSMPLIPLTGVAHPPVGYIAPTNDYSFRFFNCTDTTLKIAAFLDSAVVIFRRGKVRPTEVDKIVIGRDLKSSSISNRDSTTKTYALEYIVSEGDSFKTLAMNRYGMSFADSVHLRIERNANLVIYNRGGLTSFDLFLKSASFRIETVFEHNNIQVTPNSNYSIEPSWLDLSKKHVSILRDLNLDGIWDDTLFVDNQYIGGSPPTPGHLSNQNIYAYPNPFNPEAEQAKLRFKLAKDGNVTITVYDISNTKVKEVISAVPMSVEIEQSITWNGRNERGDIVANGVYFYIIESSSGERAVGKIAVLR